MPFATLKGLSPAPHLPYNHRPERDAGVAGLAASGRLAATLGALWDDEPMLWQ